MLTGMNFAMPICFYARFARSRKKQVATVVAKAGTSNALPLTWPREKDRSIVITLEWERVAAEDDMKRTFKIDFEV